MAPAPSCSTSSAIIYLKQCEKKEDGKKGGREKGWVGRLEPNSVRGHDDKEIFRQYSKNYIHIYTVATRNNIRASIAV